MLQWAPQQDQENHLAAAWPPPEIIWKKWHVRLDIRYIGVTVVVETNYKLNPKTPNGDTKWQTQHKLKE